MTKLNHTSNVVPIHGGRGFYNFNSFCGNCENVFRNEHGQPRVGELCKYHEPMFKGFGSCIYYMNQDDGDVHFYPAWIYDNLPEEGMCRIPDKK